ncbi:MAG: hypothetical protein IK081_13465 [Lachnospiraceae bacterium]|nr:hypothetical protein [Lachnospiraceae bacterium]
MFYIPRGKRSVGKERGLGRKYPWQQENMGKRKKEMFYIPRGKTSVGKERGKDEKYPWQQRKHG